MDMGATGWMTITPYRIRSQSVRVRRSSGVEPAVLSSLKRFSFSRGTTVRTRRHRNMGFEQTFSITTPARAIHLYSIVSSADSVRNLAPRRNYKRFVSAFVPSRGTSPP